MAYATRGKAERGVHYFQKFLQTSCMTQHSLNLDFPVLQVSFYLLASSPTLEKTHSGVLSLWKASWFLTGNNLNPYKDISVSLGDGEEQVGSVKIRAIFCSLTNKFELPIVIFFLKNRCAQLRQIKIVCFCHQNILQQFFELKINWETNDTSSKQFLKVPVAISVSPCLFCPPFNETQARNKQHHAVLRGQCGKWIFSDNQSPLSETNKLTELTEWSKCVLGYWILPSFLQTGF